MKCMYSYSWGQKLNVFRIPEKSLSAKQTCSAIARRVLGGILQMILRIDSQFDGSKSLLLTERSLGLVVYICAYSHTG